MDDFFNPPAADAEPSVEDFLAREAAALGPDAHSFTSPGAGGDKDFEASASAFPDLDGEGDFESAAAPAGLTSSFTGGQFGAHDGGQVSVTNNNEFTAFEEEYPAVELNTQQETQNGYHSPAPISHTPINNNNSQSTNQESEFIKSWKVKQSEEIAEREAAAAKRKEEAVVKAQNAIDNFYKEYNQKKEKHIAANKEEEEAFNSARTDALAQGTVWERVCDLVDLKDSRSKTSTQSKQDLTRFKEILLSLKREGESAPGAGGY